MRKNPNKLIICCFEVKKSKIVIFHRMEILKNNYVIEMNNLFLITEEIYRGLTSKYRVVSIHWFDIQTAYSFSRIIIGIHKCKYYRVVPLKTNLTVIFGQT